jgi:hypothetical protein
MRSSMICTVIQTGRWVDSACGTCWVNRNIYGNVGTETRKKRPLARTYKYIIKWVLEKYDEFVWTGLMLLTIGASGGLCWAAQLTVVFHKIWGFPD